MTLRQRALLGAFATDILNAYHNTLRFSELKGLQPTPIEIDWAMRTTHRILLEYAITGA